MARAASAKVAATACWAAVTTACCPFPMVMFVSDALKEFALILEGIVMMMFQAIGIYFCISALKIYRDICLKFNLPTATRE